MMAGENPVFGRIDVLPGVSVAEMQPYDFGPAAKVSARVKTSRAWEAADTTRHNEAHWSGASYDVLQSLESDLPELQRRTRHESINNSLIDGAIETEITNAVSSKGPALQILTDDDDFNDLIEQAFAAWAVDCEYQDGLSLVDLLEGWTAQWKIYGEILVQETIGPGVAFYKLHDVGAEAFDNTLQGANIHSGVEVNDAGQVVAYRICDPANPSAKQRLPREFGLHAYRRRFAMQRRGFPGLASVLDPAAELRDYDVSVGDAARAAADQSVFFSSDHPDAEFMEPEQKVLPVRRNVRQYIRPGWKINALPSTQPAATYQSYRKEKHTDIGNALEQPWMILRRDASNHNMSSARFDGSRYARAVERFQSRIDRRILTPIVRRFIRIGQMEGLFPPTPKRAIAEALKFDFPDIVLPIGWTWPKPPAVDNLKDALAERTKLENGTLSWSEAIAADGRRPDETLRIRTRDNAALIKAGLPPIGGKIPSEITPEALTAAVLGTDPTEDTPPTPKPDTETEAAD